MAFDDFEDGTLDLWNIISVAGGSAAASTDAEKFGVYGCRLTSNGASTPANRVILGNFDISADTVNIYCWIRTSDASGLMQLFILGTGDADVAFFRIEGDKFKYFDTSFHDFTEIPSDNTWYRFRVVYDKGTQKISYYLYDTNNDLLESHVDLIADVSTTIEKVLFELRDSLGSSYTTDFDNVTYTSTDEPSLATRAIMTTSSKWWGGIRK